MTAAQFAEWLAAMKAASLIRSDAEAGRLLDVSANTILSLKANGTDKRTALACRALLHSMAPYGTEPQPVRQA